MVPSLLSSQLIININMPKAEIKIKEQFSRSLPMGFVPQMESTLLQDKMLVESDNQEIMSSEMIQVMT